MKLLAAGSVLLLCALGGQSQQTVTVGRPDVLVSQGPSTDAGL